MIIKKRRGSGKCYSSLLQGLLPLEKDQVAYSEMHRILEEDARAVFGEGGTTSVWRVIFRVIFKTSGPH